MDNYEILETIGKGSYGIVLRAFHIPSGSEVAIKRLNKEYSNWKECSSLPEVECLKELSHPNIIKLFGIVKSHNHLNLIFEQMNSNLFEVIKQKSEKNEKLCEPQIRNIL